MVTVAAASLILAGVSAASSVAGGMEKSKEAKIAETQYQDEADQARVQGEQQEASRRQQLAETLATQDAIRAGRGVDLNSGTGQALRDSSTVAANRDINTIQANALGQERSFGLSAKNASSQATGAIIGGIGGAAGGLLSGAKAYNTLSKD